VSLVGVGVEAYTRPCTQLLLCIPQTRCNELVRLVIGDTQHEEVANIFDIRIVADPKALKDIRQRPETRQ
jgi:hypothetical protein